MPLNKEIGIVQDNKNRMVKDLVYRFTSRKFLLTLVAIAFGFYAIHNSIDLEYFNGILLIIGSFIGIEGVHDVTKPADPTAFTNIG